MAKEYKRDDGRKIDELREMKAKIGDITERVNWHVLYQGNVDEYVINFGPINPDTQSNTLRDLRNRLEIQGGGYKVITRYIQKEEDNSRGSYQLVISKTKLESGLGERRYR